MLLRCPNEQRLVALSDRPDTARSTSARVRGHGSPPVSRSQAARAATGPLMRTFPGQLGTAAGRFAAGGAGGNAGFRSSPPATSERDDSTTAPGRPAPCVSRASPDPGRLPSTRRTVRPRCGPGGGWHTSPAVTSSPGRSGLRDNAQVTMRTPRAAPFASENTAVVVSAPWTPVRWNCAQPPDAGVALWPGPLDPIRSVQSPPGPPCPPQTRGQDQALGARARHRPCKRPSSVMKRRTRWA